MDQSNLSLLNVSTHQLEYLVAMERSPTLTQAANELGMSPSALSQALTELEKRVGLPLFQREGRTRTLSARGLEMARLADHVLAATRDLTLWARQAGEGRRGTVRMGLIDIAAVGYFPDTLMQFRTERPDVALNLTVAPSGDLLRQVVDGELDAAVVVAPPASTQDQAPAETQTATTLAFGRYPEVEVTTLLREDLAVYGPQETAGPRPPVERWGPWVTFPAGSHTRQHIAGAIRALGAEFRVEAESHQPEVLRQMVRLGMGWTVLPVIQAETEPNPLIRARRAPLLTRQLVVVRRRSAPIDPATAELMARLQATTHHLDGAQSG